MCGILGGNIKAWDYEKGITAIRHRGPDAQKVVETPLCTFAFARLSIMDLSMNAMQPMDSIDGSVTIVFNGEIYGYTKLRDELKVKYPFKTTSDTEVILYAYLEYGDQFIDRIDGMFAIVIYDRREEMLKIYRDRFGIKPLYYYYYNDEFAFASEIKALTAAAGDRKWDIDHTAIFDYLCYSYIPEPKSIYKDVHKLNPACCMFYDLRARKIVKKERYWRLHVCTRASGNRKQKDINDEVRYLIRESVKEQMIADVEVGTFLSGGIDSSIVTYESFLQNNKTKAFSIGFREKKFDESYYSKLMAEKYQINQKLRILNVNDVTALQGRMKEWYDEPFADTSAFPTYIVSQIAREDVKVVLTGDGGDEIFGGYDRYWRYFKINEQNQTALIKQLNKGLEFLHVENRIIKERLDGYLGLFGVYNKVLSEEWMKEYGIDKTYDALWYLKKYYVKDLPPMTRMRYLDFKTYLPSDVLTKVDRVSMSVSLEARVPFISRKIVEYVFGLAEDECCSPDCLKKILKEAYQEVIPHEILFRIKMGFCIPYTYIRPERKCKTINEKLLKGEWPEFYNVRGV